MSRIGKKPIPVPDGTEVNVNGQSVRVKGQHGELTLDVHPRISVSFDEDAREVRVNRPNDQRQNRALHGLTRALIGNMVQGVNEPFVRKLEIVGVGYQASLSGRSALRTPSR